MPPDIGTLTTTVKITRVSSSGGMIIQNYDFAVRAGERIIYQGDTYFGFFSKAALSQQVGIRDAKPYQPTAAEVVRAKFFEYPTEPPYPDTQLRMIDQIEMFVPDGGPRGLGFNSGVKIVNPEEWFFKAHFFQDPVCPGSLGLESFLQLLKVVAVERWGWEAGGQFRIKTLAKPHRWLYRGQVIPQDSRVTVQAVVTDIDEARQSLQADGFLLVDGRIIYQMTNFALAWTRDGP